MKKNILSIVIVALVLALIGYGVSAKRSKLVAQTSSATPNDTVSYDCVSGQTAYAILAASHTLKTKDTTLGQQVLAIDGREPASQQYWAFYVNGSLASVGADAYTCTGHESVEWKLDSF